MSPFSVALDSKHLQKNCSHLPSPVALLPVLKLAFCIHYIPETVHQGQQGCPSCWIPWSTVTPHSFLITHQQRTLLLTSSFSSPSRTPLLFSDHTHPVGDLVLSRVEGFKCFLEDDNFQISVTSLGLLLGLHILYSAAFLPSPLG